MVLLVSPAARRRRRTARWYVRAYLKRWGVEDAMRGIKQQFELESFLVRTWRAIRRLLWLVAWAFWWLNLWDDDNFHRLRDAVMKHPLRLRKTVTYLFNWIATLLRQLLHPAPLRSTTLGELQCRCVSNCSNRGGYFGLRRNAAPGTIAHWPEKATQRYLVASIGRTAYLAPIV